MNQTQASAEERLEQAERKIQTLLDAEQIRALKHDYVFFGDVVGPRHETDKLVQLFTEDGVLELENLGSYTGRDAIFRGLKDGAIPWKTILHYVMAPKIEVTGDRARATWYVLAACVTKTGTDTEWCGGYYFEQYVRTPDGWRIKHMKLSTPLLTEGWKTAYG